MYTKKNSLRGIAMKKTFDFGKIAFRTPQWRSNLVQVTVELRNCGGEETFVVEKQTERKVTTGTTPEYAELSICGRIWNERKTDILCGGQCLDTIAEYRKQLANKELFDKLYRLWKDHHLNGMHAGTPEQERAIEEWKLEGHIYSYPEACEMLKRRDLYEVMYAGLAVGKRYENEPYKYGHGWLVQELPPNVYCEVCNLLAT